MGVDSGCLHSQLLTFVLGKDRRFGDVALLLLVGFSGGGLLTSSTDLMLIVLLSGSWTVLSGISRAGPRSAISIEVSLVASSSYSC